MITSEQIEAFKSDGVLVIRNFYDLEKEIHPIQEGIYHIIATLIRRHRLDIPVPEFSPDDFDAAFLPMIRHDRRLGSTVYDAIKQLPAFIRLLSSLKNEEVFCVLRNTKLAGLCGQGHGIRIDLPFEDRYRAQWHQDYTAQLRSLDGIVFWSPLKQIDSSMGPVRFCPGSHTRGILPVTLHDAKNPERTGAYAMQIANIDNILDEYEVIAPLTMPGDLVLIDFLTLHSSGYNTSDKVRWSMQMRYFNYLEPVGLSHAWKGGITTGTRLKDIHPDIVIDP